MSRTNLCTPLDDAPIAPTPFDRAGRPLEGRQIALATGGKLAPLANTLETWGAELLRCTLAACEPSTDSADLRRWLDAARVGRLADMVWLTPEGVRQTLRLAADLGRDWELVASLRRVRHFVAGRETGRALQLLGLAPDYLFPAAADVVAGLRKHNLIGRAVGLQMHHPQSSAEIAAFLRWMRTDLHAFTPYRLRSEDDVNCIRTLLAHILAGRLDAIAFGDADETRLLRLLAAQGGHAERLQRRLRAIHVIAPSRRVAAELAQVGIEPSIVPDRCLSLDPRNKRLLAALRTPRDATTD